MKRPGLRRYEWILAAFFAYIATLAVVMGREAGVVAAVAGASLMLGIAQVDAVSESRWSRVLRDWMAPGYILAAYWSLAPLARPEARVFDALWVTWDRQLLHGWGLRPLIELAGPLVPASLEFVYLLLYAMPTMLMGWIYYARRRDRLESFLEVLFASALLTYALIPLLPSAPPRLEFAGQDLPNYLSALRRLNLWLQTADITTGVFPSGHVTVAVACWLGVARAIPEWRRGQWALAVYAALLTLATVYGRYHYAVDVLAAFAAAGGAAWLTVRLTDWHPDVVPEIAFMRRRSSSS